MEYLIFRLYGPLASWGEPTVGPTRPTATHPSRSAILGLLGAALGLRRDDEAAQRRLRDSINVATKEISSGVNVRDYHTAQVPERQKKMTYRTRSEELAQPQKRLHTILSSRDYRCDGYWIVAISLRPDSAWDLEQLAEALQYPTFQLYLGRKACPLAAPLSPRRVEADGIREAMAVELPPLDGDDEDKLQWRLGAGEDVTYAWEGDGGDVTAQHTRYPYDEPLHRQRWQFASRPEHSQRSSEGE
jgi:CRISPR system Cascade subunit CasD